MSSINVRSALAGALGLVLVVLALGAAQIRISPPLEATHPSDGRTWPPRPEDFFFWNNRNEQVPPVAPASRVVIYQVPLGKRLVLQATTDFGAFAMYEDLAGILTYMDLLYGDKSFPTANEWSGWVFDPGSSVVLENVSSTATRSIGDAGLYGYFVNG